MVRPGKRSVRLLCCSSVAALVVVLVILVTPSAPPVYTYEIVHTYPHDAQAFTQGLVYVDGQFYESTGLYGASSLRRVELETGNVLQERDLDAAYFAEGLALVDDRLIQLTWQSQVGFVYDRETFALLDQFNYASEGWGLAYDGEQLMMSDGTATLHFLDPTTLTETRSVQVHDGDTPVVRLNELEYVEGEVWANVWQTNRIARIAPRTGKVVGWIDLTGLLDAGTRQDGAATGLTEDVLNGIAYDAEGERIFVTGKLWPWLFEIKLSRVE